MKLKEGEKYKFNVEKIVEMPVTKEKYYLLKHSSANRLLLPCLNYEGYGIQTGSQIICKVDKINCSGKIFLEPMHPRYREGENYYFNYLETKTITNSIGEEQKVHFVRDDYGKIWFCPAGEKPPVVNSDGQIECKILIIKKGNIYLTQPQKSGQLLREKMGTYSTYKITDTKKLKNGTEYYELEDEEGKKHYLQKSNYKHFSYKVGQKIRCKLVKFASDGMLKLEPDHPYYKIGEVYQFAFDKVKKEVYKGLYEDTVIYLKDKFGKTCKVWLTEGMDENTNIPEKLDCRVEGYRKGTVILSIVSPLIT